MADSKRHGWTKKRKIAVGIATVIVAAILYHWLQLWGIAILAVGLFALWQYAPLPHKSKLATSLVFAVVFIFAAASWNSYNMPPKINIDNALADSIGTNNNTSSYDITGNIASHKSVRLTINGTNVALNSSDDFSYKTNLNVGDNNYTLVATSGSGEDREVLTIHRNTKAEDAADNSSSSDSSSTSSSSNSSNTSSSTTSESAAFKSWNDKYGSIFTVLSNDLSQFSKDASNGDVAAAGADCQQMSKDVTTAQSQPAIPDNTAEQHWSSALTYLNSAASDCIQGVDNNDTNLITQANTEITQANIQLNDTTSAIQRIK